MCKMIVNGLFSSYESGVLENPNHPAPDGLYQMTTDPEKTPDEADTIQIFFKKGISFVKF